MDYTQSFTANGPTITVFKGWQSSSAKLEGTGSRHAALMTGFTSFAPLSLRTESKAQYSVGNGLNPDIIPAKGNTAGRSKDEDIGRQRRRLVKGEPIQKSRHSSRLSGDKARASVQISAHAAVTDREVSFPPVLGVPTALSVAEYAIPMQPRSHRLLQIYMKHVSAKTYPMSQHLKFNPMMTPEWYRFAVADVATLHGVLYAGAVYSALLEGKVESRDTIFHQSRMISIVNERLNHPGPVQESTISSLCCLALGEAMTGHVDLWHVHMRGLKHVLQARGGISTLPLILQTKVRRTDIAGAVEYAEVPYLEFTRSNRPPTWSVLPTETRRDTQKSIASILAASEIRPELFPIMMELALFSNTIRLAKSQPTVLLGPTTFAEDIHWIQYKLLSFPANLPGGTKEREIDRSCRLGALIYIKVILEQLPRSVTGSSILLRRLQESLEKIPITKEQLPLLLWLTLIGASLSEQGVQRSCFVAHLALLTTFTTLTSFNDRQLPMSRFLTLEDNLGQQLEKLWAEAMAVRKQCEA